MKVRDRRDKNAETRVCPRGRTSYDGGWNSAMGS